MALDCAGVRGLCALCWLHEYNLRAAVIKLLHLNMRKAYSNNFEKRSGYAQPQQFESLKSINIAVLNKYEKPASLTSPRIPDNRYAFLEGSNLNKISTDIQFTPRSPRVRDFLRHTTYVTKPEQLIENKKSELHNSAIGPKFLKHRPSSQKDSSEGDKMSNQSSPVYAGSLKTYGNQKYDKIASKVHTTAYFIQQLKKFNEEKGKLYEPSKHGNLTSETEKIPQSSSAHMLFDNGFRKKMGQDFYTPKPDSNPNLEKAKRGYTPNVQVKKVISPSHRKAVTIEDFILETKLGGGKFGTVFKAYHIKTRSIYALKKIPKKMIRDNMMVAQFTLEVKLQTFLKHRNILEIYGVFDDHENVYLILEYMQQGTLYSELKKKKKLTEPEAAMKLKQIANAVVYMHENGIVHRDIKPENVVMSGGVCKLCDFGWATVCDDRRKTYCGTFDYAAPEILEGAEYDLSVDLWCLGVLAYELMVGKAPFYHVSRKETIANILNVESKKILYPTCMSAEAISFINCLLKRKPEDRLTYDEILQHPFLKEVDQKN